MIFDACTANMCDRTLTGIPFSNEIMKNAKKYVKGKERKMDEEERGKTEPSQGHKFLTHEHVISQKLVQNETKPSKTVVLQVSVFVFDRRSKIFSPKIFFLFLF